MEHVTVLVCGGRNFTNKHKLFSDLYEFFFLLNKRSQRCTEIVHGGARGADSFAGMYAEHNNMLNTEYKADWDKYGVAAGPLRNQKMIDESNPSYTIAFWDGSSRGTLDMITRSVKAGIQTLILPYNNSTHDVSDAF